MNQNNKGREHLIKVAALTGGWDEPGSRFRFRQYFPGLAKRGVDVTEHVPFFERSCGLPSPFKICARIPAVLHSRNADVVWFSRELVQGYETFERLLKRPRVMDVDDAIWLDWPFGKFFMPRIARAMDVIVAGNNYLADYFSRYCKTVYVVPTAIDLGRYKLRANMTGEPPEKFIIGWTGLACNYKYLRIIAPVLHRFIQKHDRVELMVVSNLPWRDKLPSPEKVRFVPWDRDNEVVALLSMSVGIMPLTDDKWTRGKCSFKMLQYMAVGLPVVVSPVGMNREVLQKGNCGFAATSPDEWYKALERLYDDWSLQVKLGRAGRKVVEQFYDADTISIELARIFKSLLGP
ncbi:MAG: glycosyltransferase family 4 protein [Planctomycetota bacterium]|nr:glycosyltransferase family 4 protein [Planctomycetota bacterium]